MKHGSNIENNLLRISGGKFINKKLKVARESKPVMERVKNAVFSVLSDKTLDAECLDLYAGSGNLGLEAISRGAKSVVFVDESYFACQVIEENITNVVTDKSLKPNLEVVKGDAVKHIADADRYYDIVFIDPPYRQPIKHILKFLHEVLKKDGLALYFHDRNDQFDLSNVNDQLITGGSRNYGKTTVEFIKNI